MKMKCLLISIVCLFVVGVLTTSSYAKIDPETVVGMWSFDEGKGDVTADSSANKNDGTLENGPEWMDGKFGDALEFDGASSYVDCGNADNLSITGDFTFSLWVNISEYPTSWRNMLSKLVDDTLDAPHGKPSGFKRSLVMLLLFAQGTPECPLPSQE